MTPVKSFVAWLFLLHVVMLLMSCSTKSTPTVKLESWVEEKSNGEYIVVERLLELNPLTLIKGQKTAILSMKNDTDVQVSVMWYKDLPDLGLDMDSISVRMLSAQEDLGFAKTIASQFANTGGTKISIGVIKPAIYFLPFGEPDPVLRQKVLDQILALLEKNDNADYTSIWIEWMEDSIYEKECKDVIPNGYWYRGDSYHDLHKINAGDYPISYWSDLISFVPSQQIINKVKADGYLST